MFIHHNTLEALEDLPFHEALARARAELGARVRPEEQEYRGMLADGRIAEADLRAVFEADRSLGEVAPIEGLPPPASLAWLVLRYGIVCVHWRIRAFLASEELDDPVLAAQDPRNRAVLAEGARRVLAADTAGALGLATGSADPYVVARRLREQLGLVDAGDALVRCMEEAATAERLGFALIKGLARRHLPARPERARTEDPEALHDRVDEVLIPLAGAALDLGAAGLAPKLDRGLFAAGLAAAERHRRWWHRIAPLVRDTPEETLSAALRGLTEDPNEQERILRWVLLARPGWAGAVAWREHRAEAGRAAPPTLAEYAALRLLLSLGAAGDAGLPLDAAPSRPGSGPGSRADRVAQVLVLAGIGPDRAVELPSDTWPAVEDLVDRLGEPWVCRLLQEARERTAQRVWIGAIARRVALGDAAAAPPRFQVLCCIDEREESFRRAVEEVGGEEAETFGLAGFFGMAVQWRAHSDVHATRRHPIVLSPTHAVAETAAEPPALRAWLGRAAYRLGQEGRGAIGGLVASLWGPLGLASVVLGLCCPRWLRQRTDTLDHRLSSPPTLRVLREGDAHEGALPLGFSPSEAADRIAGLLRTIALADRLAPLVAVVGHGSSSRNNPHASAYDCGACGGFRGDANARIFAALANDPSVRQELSARGVEVPARTRFVGAYHDTASDEIQLWPPDDLDPSELADLRSLLERAAARNAAERSRRFARLPAPSPPEDALRHVRSRSADPSEARPEYGHATNALLVVGPRGLTRGLFLDRRAFLHSYDAATDPDGKLLTGLLGAAIPVCAGINLEYYFSRVDNERFGSGTKIPHNLTGLHGVMNGSLGDLRTGLPWQTVELHEPVRLLVVVMAPPDRLAAVIARLPAADRLVRGAWISLVALHEGRLWRLLDGVPIEEVPDGGSLPTAASSPRWAGPRRDPLEPALIRGSRPGSAP